MAIYYIDVNVGNRAGGQSARAKSEYIEREGKYAKDGEELEYRESGNMPSWAADDPRAYWSAADEHERANGVLYREVSVALPRELNPEQQRELARSFAEELTGPERLPYTMAIHRGGGDNPHVHLMISERGLDGNDRDAEQWFKRANKSNPEKGGALKTRSMMGKEWLQNTREAWAEAANRALERAGREERIDHRTLAAQRKEAIERGQLDRAAELSREPGVHLGPERHRQHGGPSQVVELDERAGHINTESRAERAEANGQVNRAAAVVVVREPQLKAQLKALDNEIRATRLAVLKEAGRRGIAQVAGIGVKVAAQVKNIIETPGRMLEARRTEREAEARRQRERVQEAEARRAAVRAVRSAAQRERRARKGEAQRKWELDAPKREAAAKVKAAAAAADRAAEQAQLKAQADADRAEAAKQKADLLSRYAELGKVDSKTAEGERTVRKQRAEVLCNQLKPVLTKEEYKQAWDAETDRQQGWVAKNPKGQEAIERVVGREYEQGRREKFDKDLKQRSPTLSNAEYWKEFSGELGRRQKFDNKEQQPKRGSEVAPEKPKRRVIER